ncbi:MAG: hypothetical protein ACKO7W_19665 [Elainella sp.]
MSDSIRDEGSGSATAQQIYHPSLPLAVYREVAAHLRQVEGLEVELLPQTSQMFDYSQSQIGGLMLRYHPETTEAARQRVEQVLAYYGERFGPWQTGVPA